MSDLDDTDPGRRSADSPPKTPDELRHEALVEIFAAFTKRTEALGSSVAWLHLDTKLLRDTAHEIRTDLATIRANTESLLEAQHRLAVVVTEIRDQLRQRTPESAPPSISGDRQSDER